jgi:hypothetical protein
MRGSDANKAVWSMTVDPLVVLDTDVDVIGEPSAAIFVVLDAEAMTGQRQGGGDEAGTRLYALGQPLANGESYLKQEQ